MFAFLTSIFSFCHPWVCIFLPDPSEQLLNSSILWALAALIGSVGDGFFTHQFKVCSKTWKFSGYSWARAQVTTVRRNSSISLSKLDSSTHPRYFTIL